eukprot:Sspe_Gene.23407::Locus_9096_Transcript_5_6_Confidence_0.250_Length_936::g.23407::m.23407/K08339/ATG5; autophagy-related protein 5
MDQEVLNEVWVATTVHFVYEAREMLVVVSRHATLSMYLPRVFEHRAQPPKGSLIWFSVDQAIPIAGHLPIGVLKDHLAIDGVAKAQALRVYIHTEKPPADTVVYPTTFPETITASFLHTMKQAFYLQYGSANAFNHMTAKTQQALLQAVVESTLPRFREERQKTNQPRKRHPIMLHVLHNGKWGCRVRSVENLRITFGEFLNQELNLRLPSALLNTDSPPLIDVLVHGITPFSSTPLEWIFNNLRYADDFVHIVASLGNNNDGNAITRSHCYVEPGPDPD